MTDAHCLCGHPHVALECDLCGCDLFTPDLTDPLFPLETT